MNTKIVLYSAISIDGYIAKEDGDSEWVKDKDNDFMNLCKETACIVVGRTTFEQYYEDLYPIPNVLNVVVTHEKDFEIHHINVKPAHSMQEVKEYLESHQVPKAILVGGGTVNTSMLKENFIDEIILIVHPLILGKGIKLFENVEIEKELELKSSEDLGNGTVKLTYQVL